MKKILYTSLLIALCACGGQKSNVNGEQNQATTKVKIADTVSSPFYYRESEELAVKTEIIREGRSPTTSLYVQVHSPSLKVVR